MQYQMPCVRGAKDRDGYSDSDSDRGSPNQLRELNLNLNRRVDPKTFTPSHPQQRPTDMSVRRQRQREAHISSAGDSSQYTK